MRHLRQLIALVIAAALAPLSLQAQESATVTGRVTNAQGQPEAAVLVRIPSLNVGSPTGSDGTYRLVIPGSRVGAGQTVQITASRTGLAAQSRTITLSPGANLTQNFQLGADAILLENVVVSAITGQEERTREVGTNVGNITVSEMNLAQVTKPADLLTGRVSGVSLQGVAGSTGTSQRIRIRGANSLSLSNEPLIFVDGVQFSNSNSISYGVGGQDVSRFNDINPADIETIEILKGPAASALYGTAAANGVILVTTKRGRAGGVRWNAYVETGRLDDENEYPANYYPYVLNTAPGTNVFTAGGDLNTAARPRCLNHVAATGACTADSVFSFNTLTDSRTTPYTTGNRQKFGVSAAGGAESSTYFLSMDREEERGVIDYNTLERTNLRANVVSQLRSDLNVQVTSSYVFSDLRLNANDNNVFSPLINGLVGGAVFFPEFDDGSRNWRNYRSFTPEEVSNLQSAQDVSRFTGGASFNYRPLGWLSANVNIGADLTGRHDFQTVQPNLLPIAESYVLGFRQSARLRNDLYTVNASGTANFNLTPSVASTTTAGVSYQNGISRSTFGSGQGISAGSNSLSAATSLFSTGEGFSQVITVGGFLRQQIALNDRIFLGASLRTDNNSAFGADYGFIYYPAASLSWVVAEEPWFPQVSAISNLRLRAAVGTSGLRPNFRDALTYSNPTAVTVNNQEVAGVTLANTGNLDLAPERTTEYEAGLDLGMFDDRMSLDVTTFRKQSRDAIILVPLAPSLGLTGSRVQNLGSIRNSGTELGLNVRAIETEPVQLNLRIAATRLSNRIVDMGDTPPQIINRGAQRHQEGYPAGAFFQVPFTYEDSDDNRLIRTSEISYGDSAEYIGPSMPTRTASFSGDLTLFRYITLSSLFDSRAGHYQLDYTTQFRCTQALSFADRGCAANSDPNASLEEQAAFLGSASGGTLYGYVHKADFVKWREAAITLGAPPFLTNRFRALSGASVTLAGRNLKTWTDYPGLDPEINETGGGTNFTQGEFNTQPPVRVYTLRFNFTF